MRSGRLAAESIIEEASYRQAWRKTLQPTLRTGVVNRFLFNMAGRRGIDFMVGHLARTDTGEALRRAYRPSVLKRLLFPLARRRFRAPLTDPSCTHEDCNCIWCEHGDHNQSPKA